MPYMTEWLLIFAGANLAPGAVSLLSPRPRVQRRHGWTARRLVQAGVPALWALLMVGAYIYFRVTEPPLTGRYSLRVWSVWDIRVRVASALAFWLTVATMLCLVVLWLVPSMRGRNSVLASSEAQGSRSPQTTTVHRDTV